jgi:hypothetical protein
MATSQGFRDLRVYQLAFDLAMEIFHESKKFPLEEKYSLTRFEEHRQGCVEHRRRLSQETLSKILRQQND